MSSLFSTLISAILLNKSTVRAHIDSIDNNTICGWVYSPKGSLEISILHKGRVLTQGVANLYREDLAKHFSSSGEHGFCLSLLEVTLPTAATLVIIDTCSGKKLKKFKVSTFCNHSSAIDQKGQDVGGKHIGLTTPWKYLRKSSEQPYFMSMHPHSAKRFESLRFHMDVLSSGDHYLAVEQVTSLHRIVVEGVEGRQEYPSFSLPCFDTPHVSIIIPAYNKFSLTYHCIASIALAFTQISYEVIIADDCSTDETSRVADYIGNVRVSRNSENLRFLRNCNRAAQLAQGQYIVFLNNDTEVCSYWLDELVGKMKLDSSIGLTGGKLLENDGAVQDAGGLIWQGGEPYNVGRGAHNLQPEYCYSRDVDYLTGAAMCVAKDTWLQVGGFSDELAPCYYEDTDLAFKIRDFGLRTVYVPQAEVIHLEGQSHGRDVTQGLKQYQVVNESTFRKKWQNSFKENAPAKSGDAELEKDRNICGRILVIDYATPQLGNDAGSYAALQEIKLIQSLGYKVTFVPENMAHFGKYTVSLQRMGVEVLYAPFYTSVQDVLQKRLGEMDAVYITRYYVARKYIEQIRQHSSCKIIFNNADLHFFRELRLVEENKGKGLRHALKIKEKELKVCEDVDVVLCYTPEEKAVISSHIHESKKIHITPWVLQPQYQDASWADRTGIAFLGGYTHTPNVKAVEFLVNEVMPLLREKNPDIVLYVYGSKMPESFKKFSCSAIKVMGYAESLSNVYLKHRIFVAPLSTGAGIKGKVLDAFAYGTPTVLSDLAVEGTGANHNISCLVADKGEEWATAIALLYNDSSLWQRLADNSKVLAKSRYSFIHGKEGFKKIFATVGLSVGEKV